MANGGCKQKQQHKSICSYTGKAASTLDLTYYLSWLLDQSTIDYLLSTWVPFWAHMYMKSSLNEISNFQKLYLIVMNLKKYIEKLIEKSIQVID